MKQFFKLVLATMVGFILSYLVIIVIFIVIVFGIVSSVTSEKRLPATRNSVLELNFDLPVIDRTSQNPFESFDWNTLHANRNPGLNDILKNIKKASTDNNIRGIFMNLSVIPAGIATIEEIRNALIDFKKSGKFIYTYSESLGQGAYYLSTVSDKVFLNPQGTLDFRGLRSEMLFFKGSFEKLEIEPQIIRHGKYKSFIEPFVLDKMSNENREQMTVLMNTIWKHIIENISSSRKISVNGLQEICDNIKVRKPEDAVNLHLVDSLIYMDGMLDVLKNSLGLKGKEKVNFVKLSRYSGSEGVVEKKKFTRQKIAVIYASGEINGGDGDEESIGSDRFSETLRKARLDSTIKAIVLRVNSPGGSALASDIIWREVFLTRQVKPVIVSMGDVAASGGYYISCAADKIIAQPNTITGSIGVLGIMFNTKKLLNNKLGITVDTLKTARMADFGSSSRPLTEAEKVIMQQYVENVYEVFLSRVAEGRKMSRDAIDSIGQGRVWTGTDAKQIGLVDEIGGIKEAVSLAAKLAKTSDYKILELPDQKEPIKEILEELTGDARISFMRGQLGEESYRYYKQFQSLLHYQGIQARMPFSIEVY